MHSRRQLYTIKTFGKKEMGSNLVLHSGPFGCGKTHSLVEAFGLYCLKLKKQGIQGLTFVLLGRTQQAVKKNMCNVLTKLFGNDFRYDTSKKDGIMKDAVLFGQYIYIIGLNDTSSEGKFRGISDIMGILHDEAVLCTREQFEFILGRLRGERLEYIPDEYLQHWYIGSTNPDSPNHFLLEYVASGVLKMVKWSMKDALWDGAKEYYKRLKLLYKNNPSFLARYLLGKWTSADRMVYCMFQPKVHILKNSEVELNYKEMKRNFIALDYGGDHPTAILLISLNHQGLYIVTRELKLRNTAPSSIVEKVCELFRFVESCGSYVSSLYVDPSSKSIKDELDKKGIKHINALNKHIDGIGYIQTCFSLNKLFILDTCENLINEIYSYRYKDTNNGKDEVIKVNDDFVDALRYGVYSDSIIGG